MPKHNKKLRLAPCLYNGITICRCSKSGYRHTSSCCPSVVTNIPRFFKGENLTGETITESEFNDCVEGFKELLQELDNGTDDVKEEISSSFLNEEEFDARFCTECEELFLENGSSAHIHDGHEVIVEKKCRFTRSSRYTVMSIIPYGYERRQEFFSRFVKKLQFQQNNHGVMGIIS